MRTQIIKLCALLVIGGAMGTNGTRFSLHEIVYAADRFVVVQQAVSLRTAPSLTAPRIRYVEAGTSLLWLSTPNRWWYRVQDDDKTIGFVSAQEKYVTAPGDTYAQPDGRLHTDTPPSSPLLDVPPHSPTASVRIERVIALGLSYIGTPYEWGSDRQTTTTFDCSDFIYTIFRDGANETLPKNSQTIATAMQLRFQSEPQRITTAQEKLRRGDIVFFSRYRGNQATDYAQTTLVPQPITHVAVYLGNDQILHTYSLRAGGVRLDTLSGTHWAYRLQFGVSLL